MFNSFGMFLPVNSASDKIGIMRTFIRLCCVGIVALLPLAASRGQVSLSFGTPAPTTASKKCLIVAAAKTKKGDCSEEEPILNEVEYVRGSMWEFRDKSRERARKMRPDAELKHFRVIEPGQYAFFYTYKKAGVKCTHSLAGVATGSTEAEARNEMNAVLREAKAGDHRIIAEWPDDRR